MFLCVVKVMFFFIKGYEEIIEGELWFYDFCENICFGFCYVFICFYWLFCDEQFDSRFCDF